MIWRTKSDLSRFFCSFAAKVFCEQFCQKIKVFVRFFSTGVNKMHWSFYIFALVALSGWSLGRIVRAITKPPAWLFDL